MSDTTSAKLRSHIFDAEPELLELTGMLTVAGLLVEQLADAATRNYRASQGRQPESGKLPEEALTILLGDIATRADDLRSWWRQLHELGVVGSGETANVEKVRVEQTEAKP